MTAPRWTETGLGWMRKHLLNEKSTSSLITWKEGEEKKGGKKEEEGSVMLVGQKTSYSWWFHK